ncbi:centrosomal protein POC5-like [Corvus hawaiiensis]|uniref:centrosomal protein POC5-like n=1 Tax=Corvus hawaiiensis TaxID=134902 RepID=UPI002019FB2A|nr:centrosomal protein POC5-like [Corvus hawaiiensis]
MRQEKEKHAAHVKQLQNEMENLKELLHTCEISVSRKDEVITNLTQALEKQKERVELMRTFTMWRIQHVKTKQEEYANSIADRHFQRALMKKVWAAWRSASEVRWKDKVARACQLRAEDVCVQLTNDYEAKIAELTATLEQRKAEILRLHSERDHYEDTLKKAFMRGVGALNLEAMSMFQSKDSRPDPAKNEKNPNTTTTRCHSSPWNEQISLILELLLASAASEIDAGSRRNDNAPTDAGRPPPSQYNPPSPPPPPAASLQMEGMFSSHLAHGSTPETRLDADSPGIISSTAGSGVTSTQKLKGFPQWQKYLQLSLKHAVAHGKSNNICTTESRKNNHCLNHRPS